MMKLPDIQEIVSDLWSDVHAPKVTVDGIRIRLVHPFGPFVALDLTKADLALPPQEFAEQRIKPPLALLRSEVAKVTRQ
jgi:hypothetical protein